MKWLQTYQIVKTKKGDIVAYKICGVQIKINLKHLNERLQSISQRLNVRIPEVFLKRNIELYVNNNFFGMHRFHNKTLTQKEELARTWLELKLKLQYILFKKIYIPHLEFVLTTRCTLRCQYCINHIPSIEKDKHQTYSLAEFQQDLGNILQNIVKLDSLCLLGGEPLLVKDLDKMCLYAAQQPKISKIYIVTNGTIPLPQNLIDVAKKYREKVWILLSNYSKNPELKGIIKDDYILNQIKENNLKYLFNQDLMWLKSTPAKDFQRTEEECRKIFLQCLYPCASIVEGKIHICPRASTMYVRNFFTFKNKDYVDVRHFKGKKLRKMLIKFYNRKCFSACGYCNIINEHDITIPALQIKL